MILLNILNDLHILYVLPHLSWFHLPNACKVDMFQEPAVFFF